MTKLKLPSEKFVFPERAEILRGWLKNAVVVHNGQLFIRRKTRASEPACIVRTDNVSPYLRDCIRITRVAKANEWIVIESIARMSILLPQRLDGDDGYDPRLCSWLFSLQRRFYREGFNDPGRFIGLRVGGTYTQVERTNSNITALVLSTITCTIINSDY